MAILLQKTRQRDSAARAEANTTKIHPDALDHVVVNSAGDGGGGEAIARIWQRGCDGEGEVPAIEGCGEGQR